MFHARARRSRIVTVTNIDEKIVAMISYPLQVAAAKTGFPQKTLRAAIDRGELSSIRSGRRVIVLHDDLVAWLQKGKAEGTIPGVIDDVGRERLATLNRLRSKQTA
jgi:hypothetical protein